MSNKSEIPPAVAEYALEQLADGKDPQRISDAAENCEVLRARLAKYEDADGNPIAQQPRAVVPTALIEALKFYANGDHFLLADPDSWDTCSGEPLNFQHDDAGTASVEDGSIAKAALARLNSSPVSAPNHSEQVRHMVPDASAMADRFISWPLPNSVRPDPCAMNPEYPHRYGTNLLTWAQAKAMFEYVLAAAPSAGSHGGDV